MAWRKVLLLGYTHKRSVTRALSLNVATGLNLLCLHLHSKDSTSTRPPILKPVSNDVGSGLSFRLKPPP